MHSSTLRRASPGLSGPAALLITFSTSSSVACKTTRSRKISPVIPDCYKQLLTPPRSGLNDSYGLFVFSGCWLTTAALLWFITLIVETVGWSGVTTNIRGKDVQTEGFRYLPSRTSWSRWRRADTDPSAPGWRSHRTAARWHVPSEERSVSRNIWGEIRLF